MKLTLKNLLILAAAGLGILAFIMMFLTPITVDGGTATMNYKFKEIYFKSENGMKGATISFIGFILILLGGLIFAASLFTNIGDNKIIMIGAIGLMIVGAILVFLTRTIWLGINDAPEQIYEYYKIGAGPILGGICGVLGGLCGCAATFVIKD